MLTHSTITLILLPLEDDEDDPNLDEDAPRDSSEVDFIPRKRKYKSLEELLDDTKYDRVPLQDEATFTWSNKAGQRVDWVSQSPALVKNQKGCGRRSLKDIAKSTGGPTEEAFRTSGTIDGSWSSIIKDESLKKLYLQTDGYIPLFLHSNIC